MPNEDNGMKLAISVLDGDHKTFPEIFETFSDSWRSLRYTLKISLMLKKGHQLNNSHEDYEDISQARDDYFTLTLTFLHVVALARKKQPLLDFLDQEISMEDWLEPVSIRKSNLLILN